MAERYYSYRKSRRRAQWAVMRYLAAFEATTRSFVTNKDGQLPYDFDREVREVKTLQRIQSRWDRQRFKKQGINE
jgi:hypothetical protein